MSSSHLATLSQRRGAVAPLTILSLGLLIGVAALVIDGGTLMEARRHVQAAADAAALAGASDLYANWNTNQGVDLGDTAMSSAQATASANGFTDGVQSIVTVRTCHTSPPTYLGGPNAGQTIPPGYIEVTIQYNAPHLFSGVFGAGTSPVRARAVARGRGAPLQQNGLIALSLNAAGALNVVGLSRITVNGGIQINSNNAQALQVNGSTQITATQFILNSAIGGQGGGWGLLGSLFSLLFGPNGSAPTIITAPPAPDPLRYLLPPPPPPSLAPNPVWSGNTVHFYPGSYNRGIQVSGGSLLTPITVQLHGNSDGTPGIYYLNGKGLQANGYVNITTASDATAGIMIYNNWSNATTDIINVNGNGSINIIPPLSGPYRGLGIFQRRGTSSTTPGPAVTIKGNATLNTGTIYAAHASVSVSGNALVNTIGGQIIADTIVVSGNGTLTINPNIQPIANQRLLGLVE